MLVSVSDTASRPASVSESFSCARIFCRVRYWSHTDAWPPACQRSSRHRAPLESTTAVPDYAAPALTDGYVEYHYVLTVLTFFAVDESLTEIEPIARLVNDASFARFRVGIGEEAPDASFLIHELTSARGLKATSILWEIVCAGAALQAPRFTFENEPVSSSVCLRRLTNSSASLALVRGQRRRHQ